jgi:hypothetical protein
MSTESLSPDQVNQRSGLRSVAKTAMLAFVAFAVVSILAGTGLYVWSVSVLAASSGTM